MGITEAVTVVVVTYRSAPTIEACLRSLSGAAGGHPVQVIVVDNASDDDTVARAQRSGVTVELVSRPANDGFAVACNAGLARATGKWVLFANPDTVWPAASLARLLDVADEHPEAGLICPALENPDRSPQSSIETDFDLRRVLAGLVRVGGANRPAPPPAGGPPVPVDWAHGAAMLMPVGLARQLGGWDERFFLFFEDLDLCLRVRQAGRSVLVVPEVRVGHVGGASMARTGDDGWVAGQRVLSLAMFLANRHGVGAARLYAGFGLVAYGLTPTRRHRAMAAAAARALVNPRAGRAGG